MRRSAAAIIAIWIGLSAGCLERRMVVVTDPPGALILRNGQPIGNAPADDHFLYYGTYHFTAIKPGYATLQAYKKVAAPWYEWFPLDLFTEIFVPFQLEDVRRIELKLEPLREDPPEQITARGDQLREKSKTIIPPPPAPLRNVNQTPPWYALPMAPVPGTDPAAGAPGGPFPPGSVMPAPEETAPAPRIEPAPLVPGRDVTPGFSQPQMQPGGF